jgi:hypothetical protein
MRVCHRPLAAVFSVLFALVSSSSLFADGTKQSLFVFGIHTSGIEGEASEFRDQPTDKHPGAMALIRRNLQWSIDLADAAKFGSKELRELQAEVGKLTFAQIEDRMAALRLSYQAKFAKEIDPAAPAPFILGIWQSGAERVAGAVSGFPRDKKPGSVALIERNLSWLKGGATTVGVSTDLLLKIDNEFRNGAAFAPTAAQLETLRFRWQQELLNAPPFGAAPIAAAVNVGVAPGGFTFGVAMPGGKLLTYTAVGGTNSTVVRIDGKSYVLGASQGKTLEAGVRQPDGSIRSTWTMDGVRFTQVLETIMSQRGARDTMLARWIIRNEGNAAHRVGLRLELDTLIGSNDGVPFAVPGMSGLVNTSADFTDSQQIPHFIQALERPNLADPGTVAHLTTRVGGTVEPPSRVSLTRWPGISSDWDVKIQPMGTDSAVILYWGERDLTPSQTREIGFAYGLGDVRSSQGRIGATTVANAQTGSEFPISAYVKEPAANETLTLVPPAGLRVVGSATVPVPPPPADSKDRTSLVTWKAVATQAGQFDVAIRSSTGAVQQQTINVAKGAEVVQGGETPKEDPAVAAWIRKLEDSDEAIRLRAAKELGRMGAVAVSAIPSLENAAHDPDQDVRTVAGNSLAAIRAALTAQPTEQVRRLIAELGAASEMNRLIAAHELGKIGPAAREAIPALEKLLQDSDADVRKVAGNAIDRIRGAVTPPADPGVVRPPVEQPTNLEGTTWQGSETLADFGKLAFRFEANQRVVMTDAKAQATGQWSLTGDRVTITFNNCVYTGVVQGSTLAGAARFTDRDLREWNFTVRLTDATGSAPTVPRP